MRIIYVSSSFIPSQTANSIQVMKMCQALGIAGHQVTLVARSGGESADHVYGHYGVSRCFDIVRFYRPSHKGAGVVYGVQVRRWMSVQFQADLLYGRSVHGLLATGARGKRIVYEAHTPPKSRIHKALEARLLQHPGCVGLVTISHALKNEYLRLFPWLEVRRILVAPDAADPPPSEGPEGSPGGSLGREDRLQVGYVGQLYPGKGMEIIGALAPTMPDVDFHVIGGNDLELARWKEVSVAENLHFHGFVAPGSLSAYYTALDVLLAPYQRRVFGYGRGRDISPWMSPLKLFEYMSYGKPIVASDLAALREILRHSENALLCPPDDVSKWRESIRLLERDAKLRGELGRTAKDEFRTKYTWAQRVKTILQWTGNTG